MGSYDSGAGLGGAASGAMMGSAFGPIGTVVGGALGALSGFGTKKGKEGTQGIMVQPLPQYSWTEPRLRLTSDYLTQNIERMGRGEMPVWWDKASKNLNQGMKKNLYETYYGRPGERTGVMQTAMQAGALGGVGPKGMVSNVRRASQDYASKSSQIDQYLTGLGADIMRQQEGMYLSESRSQPVGPPVATMGYQTQGTPSTNPYTSLLSSMGGMMGSGGLQGMLGGFFGGGSSGAGTMPGNYITGTNSSTYTPVGSLPSNYSGSSNIRW